MTKRISLFILMIWAMFGIASAQKLIVESVKTVGSDISASQYERKDLNGLPCALIKLQSVDDISRVEGNVVGDIVSRGTEKWIYMTAGTKEIKIIPKSHLPIMISFSQYGINKLEEKITYTIVLAEEVHGQEAPLVISTDGPNELNIDEITNHMFGIAELKLKPKFKDALKTVRKIYPDTQTQEKGSVKQISLDKDCGYMKTLMGQPLSAKAQWINVLGMGGGTTTSYSITLRTERETAMNAVSRLTSLLTDKGFKASDPSGLMKSAYASYEYYKDFTKKGASMYLALSLISPGNYLLTLCTK